MPSDRTFLEIDPEPIKRMLRLEERGRDRGRNQQPPTTSVQLDDIEQEICNAIASELRNSEDTFNSEMRVYADRLSAANLATSETEVEIASRDAIATFRTEAQTESFELKAKATDYIESIRWLHEFRSQSALRRPAHYPEKASKFFMYGVLSILFLLEIAANAYFLGKGDEYGFAGGSITATTVAFLNVGLSYLVGRIGLRQLWHRQISRRIIGVTCLSAWALFAGWLNTMLAYFRELSERGDVAAATRDAATLAINGPGDLTDAKSWFLLAIGVFFAFIALLDGLFSDDLYPGYGKVDRQYRQREISYHDRRIEAVQRIEEPKSELVDELRDLRAKITARRNEYERILTARARLRHDFAAHLRQIASVREQLLAVYRVANREARSTPAPSHFNTQPPFSLPSIPGEDEYDRGRDAVVTAAATVERKLESAIHEVFSVYEHEIATLRDADEMVASERARATS